MTKLDFIHKTLDIKSPPDFTVVSTFSGCGGSSTGYVWAGGKVLLAVEWDDNAVGTYRLNYPNTDVYHGDIAKLTVQEVLDRTGLQVGELDIFDGSPPCQGFSTAGKRIVDDPRNQLFREYCRLLKGLQPKVFVMENVSGMVRGKMKLLFAEILTELKGCGYKVSAKLLNAMYLGVPQSRQRMIFIGVRDDLGIEPSHPKPKTNPIMVQEAFNNIPPMNHEWAIVKPSTKIHKMLLKTQQGQRIRDYGIAKRLSFHEVAGTIRTGSEFTPSAPSSSWFAHPTEHRGISIREAARIQSFPDCFEFVGSLNDKTTRVGNAVPPRMMQYIAEHIRDNILNH
jgi:DNA (cytosine-5)-methyltransferase 1